MRNICDIHCHILPEVDDGASSMEESLNMLRMEFADGVQNIILTPHYRKEMFETPEEKMEQQFQALREAAKQILPELHLYLGCEVHTSMDMLEVFQYRKHLTLAGSSFVLTEFGGRDTKAYIKERCYSLLSNGYQPILAHVERYSCMMDDPGLVNGLRQMGCMIQVNAESILGKGGWAVKRFCRKLMQEDLLDFVGSDAHGTTRRIPQMGTCADYIEKKMGTGYAGHILRENPSIILGKEL